MVNDAWKQLQDNQGKYILVNALSRRIRELHSGHKPLVSRPTSDLTALAAEEIRQNKLLVRKVDKGDKPAPAENEEETGNE